MAAARPGRTRRGHDAGYRHRRRAVTGKALIVGYGNPLRGDDGIGQAVAQAFAHEAAIAGAEAVDLLVTAEGERRFAAPRIASPNLHGTGCTLSSAIAAHIALGADLTEAVAAAKAFVRAAIERGRDVKLGEGVGPLIQIPLGPRRG